MPITKHVFVGELYAKERREMEAKLRGLFTGKKERLFFATMCRSCFNENMIGLRLKGSILNVQPFELVQMSKKA
ncbi:MAG: hypothetical protein KGI49_01245 [Patescibacteria group bacterium]|nr:hypothetical protein [Patescibacteria group bacterium]